LHVSENNRKTDGNSIQFAVGQLIILITALLAYLKMFLCGTKQQANRFMIVMNWHF
tara:strand:+ start:2186 stop:2353 length:168 start_codon:yes stop_codon:yes gene_type:complete